MKTSAWATALILVTGCVGNSISLDANDDGATDSDSDSNSDTWPTTAESGDDESGDDGPECDFDSDCDHYCGWCSNGTCVDDEGCCSHVEPTVWRCSPPFECWDDSECPDGEICDQGWGECVPDPNAGLRQPPMCDDLVLLAEQFPVDAPLQQVVMHSGLPMGQGGLLAIDAEQRLVQIDPADGALTPMAALPGTTVELFAAGPAATVAIGTQSEDGGDVYRLSRIEPVDDAWQVIDGPITQGPALDGAWLGDVAMVASMQRLDRWAVAPAPTLLTDHPLEALAVAIAPAQATAEGPLRLGVLDALGRMNLLDVDSGNPAADPFSVEGEPVDLAAARDVGPGDGEDLVSLTAAVVGEGTEGEQRAALVQVIRNLDAPSPDEPFGTFGRPLALAVADVDGDGIDDVIVGLDEGRVVVFRMHETDVLCQSYIPLGSDITDMAVGDVDGDGAADVIVAESGAGMTILHGRP